MTDYLVKNCHTLAAFDDLEAQKKEPKLAVWRGKKLVIVSYKGDSIFEKICIVFKKVFYFVFQLCLTEDTTALKDTVLKFYSEQHARHDQSLGERVIQLEKQLTEKRTLAENLTAVIEKDQNILANLRASVKKISEEEAELVALRDSKKEAEETLRETQEFTNRLNDQIRSLTERITPLKKQFGEYERGLQAITTLKAQNKALSNEITQLKGRPKPPVSDEIVKKEYEARIAAINERHKQETDTLKERIQTLMNRAQELAGKK